MISPHHVTKEDMSPRDLAIRAAMIANAFKDHPNVAIAVAGRTTFPNYAHLARREFGEKSGMSLRMIMGVDAWNSIVEDKSIHNTIPELGEGDIIRIRRADYEAKTVDGIPTHKVTEMEIDRPDISSSGLREMVKSGKLDDAVAVGWVTKENAQIIRDYNLYRPEARRISDLLSGTRGPNILTDYGSPITDHASPVHAVAWASAFSLISSFVPSRTLIRASAVSPFSRVRPKRWWYIAL